MNLSNRYKEMRDGTSVSYEVLGMHNRNCCGNCTDSKLETVFTKSVYPERAMKSYSFFVSVSILILGPTQSPI
jgi:hypothetical protein